MARSSLQRSSRRARDHAGPSIWASGPFLIGTIGVLLTFVIGAAIGALARIGNLDPEDPWLDVGQGVLKTLYQALVVGALGGLFKLYIDFTRRRADEENAQIDTRKAVLVKLVGCAHQMDIGRTRLMSNKSVKTLTEVFEQNVIPTRVQLREISHDVRTRKAAGQPMLGPRADRAFTGALTEMLKYTDALVFEYASRKADLGELQLVAEQARPAMASTNAEEREGGRQRRELALKEVHGQLAGLALVSDFQLDGENYGGKFRAPYSTSLGTLRSAVRTGEIGTSLHECPMELTMPQIDQPDPTAPALSEEKLAELDARYKPFADEVSKLAASESIRVRTDARHAWPVAAAIGAVLAVVVGTEDLREARLPVQVVGFAAVAIWLSGAVAFMRVPIGMTPAEDKEARVWARLEIVELSTPIGETLTAEEMKRELKKFEEIEQQSHVFSSAIEGLAQKIFFERRFRKATWLIVAAVLATGVAFVVTIVEPKFSDDEMTGQLLLSSAGAVALAEACPLLETSADDAEAMPQLKPPPIVTARPSDLGQETFRVRLDRGVCREDAVTHLTLRGSLVLGFAE